MALTPPGGDPSVPRGNQAIDAEQVRYDEQGVSGQTVPRGNQAANAEQVGRDGNPSLPRRDGSGGQGVRPGEFCRQLLQAMDASEGRRRRRKRDTTPDALGMELKREVLARAAAADPSADAFESWLVDQVLAAAAAGPVRAVCAEILDEYRVASQDPTFATWLAAGAPSADADDVEEPNMPRKGGRPRPDGVPA